MGKNLTSMIVWSLLSSIGNVLRVSNEIRFGHFTYTLGAFHIVLKWILIIGPFLSLPTYYLGHKKWLLGQILSRLSWPILIIISWYGYRIRMFVTKISDRFVNEYANQSVLGGNKERRASSHAVGMDFESPNIHWKPKESL